MEETREALVERGGERALEELRAARPGPEQVLIEVSHCALCPADLLPRVEARIPGHQLVGRVIDAGDDVDVLAEGDRVAVGWWAGSCGSCAACAAGELSLCPAVRATGEGLDGGCARFTLADHRAAFLVPPALADVELAPLLCAGTRGWRALRSLGGGRIGFYGGGYAAGVLIQLAIADGIEACVFVEPGDDGARQLATALGAYWVGSTAEAPPGPLDAGLVLAPRGELAHLALLHLAPGGQVVCATCSFRAIPPLGGALLAHGRGVRAEACAGREDVCGFFARLAEVRVRAKTETFPLAEHAAAYAALAAGREPVVLRLAR